MFFRNYFLILKILLLSASVSYGQEANNCQTNLKDKIITAIEWPYYDKKQPLNTDYWVTSQQVLQQSVENIIWVDIRSRVNTTLVNTISLSLVELESASFLFDSHIVLVGNGFDQLQLDKAINRLRKVGFKNIFALYGGVREWGKVSQQKISLTDEVSPEEFLLGSKTILWRVISIGLTDDDIKSLPIKPSKQFDSSIQSLTELTHFITDEKLTNSPFIAWVLVANDKKDIHQLKQQLQIYPFSEQVVWLQGGLRNYQNYIKQHHQINANAGLILSRPCGLAF